MKTPRPIHQQFAADVLTEVFALKRPADAILQDLFRAKKQMGSKDRAAVSEMVYGVLRSIFALRAVGGEAASAADLVVLWLKQEPPPGNLSAAVRLNLPGWLYASLVSQHGEAVTARLALALNQPATVDLRVNTLKVTREQAIKALAADNLAATPTPLSPLGLRLRKRAALQATRAYREGYVEPQDEGSQLLALLVDAKPGETVVDFCAGAGGKTLALAAQMANQGVIHACDTRSSRLNKLPLRQKRAGVSIINRLALRHENDALLGKLQGRADAVLVDAPCSGSGRLRRNPELRLHSFDLAALAQQQLSILAAAARLVRPGGRLIYATCSLSAEENENVITAFKSKNPGFEERDTGILLATQNIPVTGARLKLLPHTQGTDGFFACALRRVR